MNSILKRAVSAAAVVSMFAAGMNSAYARIGVGTHVAHGYSPGPNSIMAAKMNADWVRDGLPWSSIETTKGTYRIPEDIEKYFKTNRENGLKNLATLAFGNTLYDFAETRFYMPARDGNAATTADDEYYEAWLAYVRNTVAQTKDYIDAYEIWNEPDLGYDDPDKPGFNANKATAAQYAQLYLDTKKIINELAPDAKVVCGALTLPELGKWVWADQMLAALKALAGSENKSINGIVDIISIHSYATDSAANYSNTLNHSSGGFEQSLDKVGYTGGVWMTETGISTTDGGDAQERQAAFGISMAVRFDKYLKDTGRTGEFIWYDLRNDGTSSTEREHNFGLLNYNYQPKPAYYAFTAFNDLTEGMDLKSCTAIDSFYYGFLAKYSDGRDITYIATDEKEHNVSVPLSGDAAYVYDYLGNLTETIKKPSGSKTFKATEKPVFISCVTYDKEISSLSYDAERNVLTVSGKWDFGSSATLEILNAEGKTVQTETVYPNSKGLFEHWFSLDGEGSLTVRLGKAELSALGRTDYEEKTFNAVRDVPDTPEDRTVAGGTVVTYNSETKAAKVSGSIDNFTDTDCATVLVVPKTPYTADKIAACDMNEIAYIGQTELTDGNFSFSFNMPQDSVGDYAIYIGGTRVREKQENSLNAGAVPEYVYVSGFNAQKSAGNKAAATAKLKNPGSEPKKAIIVLIQYSGGVLIDAASESVTVPPYTTAAADFTYSADIDGRADSVYAFLWEDWETMRPLAPKTEVR